MKITTGISPNDKALPDFNIGSQRSESRHYQAKTTLKNNTIGISPSGKAPGFDLGIQRFKSSYPSHIDAEVAELVGALDLGSSILGCEISSLSFRTILCLGEEVK